MKILTVLYGYQMNITDISYTIILSIEIIEVLFK